MKLSPQSDLKYATNHLEHLCFYNRVLQKSVMLPLKLSQITLSCFHCRNSVRKIVAGLTQVYIMHAKEILLNLCGNRAQFLKISEKCNSKGI